MTNLAQLTVPNPGDGAANKAQAALTAAESRVIATAEDYAAASEDLKSIKSKFNEIEDARKKLKKPIDDAAKAVQEFFRGPLDFLTRAEGILKRKLVAYQNDQEQKRREAQAKADADAAAERRRLQAQADKAAAAGKTDKADALQQRASTIVSAIVETEAPKVAGQTLKDVWRFEIIDASLVPRAYMTVDEKKIRGVVNSLKDEAHIPGVRVFKERALASSAA